MTTDTEIRDRFWKELEKNPFLMIGLDGTNDHSQPMTAQFDESHGPIWFYTSRDNKLVTGLQNGSGAMAQYVAKGHDLFGCLHGPLVVDHDPALIDRFWSNQVEAWFPEGRNDPTLTLLRFDPHDAELWLADMSIAGTFKMLFGGDMRAEGQRKHAEVAM